MNKKIKIIELFQKSANNEELPKKIYFDGDVFELDTEGVYKSNGTLLVDCLNYDLSNLNDYIKVLEDNTEEIEELKKEQEAIANPKTMMQEIRFYYDSNKMGDKINEIIRYIKRKDKNND